MSERADMFTVDTGFGSAQSIDGSDSTEDTRARQGYGEDSGVGG